MFLSYYYGTTLYYDSFQLLLKESYIFSGLSFNLLIVNTYNTELILQYSYH